MAGSSPRAAGPVGGTTRARRIAAALAGVVLALVGLLAVPVGAGEVGGEAEGTGPTVALVHQVDGTGAPVEVSLLTDRFDVGAGAVSVVENGTPIGVEQVLRATAAGHTAEVVFVVDTSDRLATGGAFDRLKAAVAAEIRSLPEGTRVAVVAASDLALTRQTMTSDLEAAAAAAEDLRLGTSAALWDAMGRAAEQFSDRPDRIRSVVAVSASPDRSRTATAATVQAALVRATAQVVAVRYGTGDPALGRVAQRVGGVAYDADAAGEPADVLGRAVEVARDRLVVSYASGIERGQLAEVDLVLGEVGSSFSFTAGARFDRVTSLTPIEGTERSALPVIGGLLESRAGLYVVLLLALVGVGLAVWSIASLFGQSNEDLDRRLSRYSPASDDNAADGGGLGQHALIRRAVAMTESIARDRGVLAKVEALLERSNLPLRPAEALFAHGVIVVVLAVAGLLLSRSMLGLLVAAAVGAAGPYLFVSYKVSQRQRRFEAQLPDALQLLAGTLRAGYSLPQGMEAVSHEIADPMGFELRRVMTEARLGRELEEALEAAAARLDSPDFAWAVMAISIQREVGGNLNELLLTVAETMVARERLRGEVKALTAEGKMSAIILGGLPPGLGVVMWAMNPDYVNTLFTETMGQLLVGLAVVAATIGLFWMRKVIRVDV